MEVDDDRREQIIREHPLLYPENFFFEFNDGWLDLIEELSDDLEAKIQELKDRYPSDEMTICTQAKEKFGTLRYYINTGTNEMWESIDRAELASRTICEICGQPAKLINGRRLKTRCDKHISA